MYVWQSQVEIKHYSVVFQSHYHVRSAVTQNLPLGVGLYALCKCVKYP